MFLQKGKRKVNEKFVIETSEWFESSNPLPLIFKSSQNDGDNDAYARIMSCMHIIVDGGRS